MKKRNEIGAMIKGLTAAFLLTVILLLAAAFLMLQFMWGIEKLSFLIMAVYMLACLAGGWITGKSVEKRKFFFGLLTGVCYFMLLLCVSALRAEGIQSAAVEGVAVFVLCLAGGMIGGMLS